MIARTLLRLLVAAVWLHQGSWKKVVRPDPHHVEIVAAVPGLPAGAAAPLTRGLGLVETGLALWVLSGRRRRLAAAAQTALLVGMNAGGLAFARGLLTRRRRMLVRNTAFLACLWSVG